MTDAIAFERTLKDYRAAFSAYNRYFDENPETDDMSAADADHREIMLSAIGGEILHKARELVLIPASSVQDMRNKLDAFEAQDMQHDISLIGDVVRQLIADAIALAEKGA